MYSGMFAAEARARTARQVRVPLTFERPDAPPNFHPGHFVAANSAASVCTSPILRSFRACTPAATLTDTHNQHKALKHGEEGMRDAFLFGMLIGAIVLGVNKYGSSTEHYQKQPAELRRDEVALAIRPEGAPASAGRVADRASP